MASWRKCRSCSKVKQTADFDGESPVCLDCTDKEARAAARAAKKAAGPVKVTRRPATPRTPARPAATTAPAAPPPPPPVADPLRAVGLGDLEAREKRARRRALDALVEEHAEEFAALHAAARATHAASGETDVRARRARREAVDDLVEANGTDFARLLEGFRGEEGLRRRTGPSPADGASTDVSEPAPTTDGEPADGEAADAEPADSEPADES